MRTRFTTWLVAVAIAACGTGQVATTSASQTTVVIRTTSTTIPPTTSAAVSTTVAPAMTIGETYSVQLDPADFVASIDNPWLPLKPGDKWIFEGKDGDEVEHIEVVVTGETRQIMGITATVVRDTVTINGELAEDTHDWYAQDKDGNVWYLGEDTAEYENGKVVSTAGAWEAGVDGALPGIIMLANPRVGDAYRQEFYAGEAEDVAEVVRTGATETLALGQYDGLLVIKEWTPLDPDVAEEKSYAMGVGLVLEHVVKGGSGRIELIEYQAG